MKKLKEFADKDFKLIMDMIVMAVLVIVYEKKKKKSTE